MRGATVLVTGATGFIGSHLVERLLSEGATVRCLLRPSPPRGAAGRHPPPPGAVVAPGDLVRGSGLDAALDGTGIVFHLAGVTKAVRASDYQLGNVQATENLLAAMSRGSASLIHVSSLAAMGPSADAVPLREEATPCPLTNYGRSKLRGEQAVRRAVLSERAVVIRPPVVYGPRDVDVFRVLRAAARGTMVRIGYTESYFSFIHVADLVDGLILAAQHHAAAGNTYFLSNPEPVSWSDFAATAASTTARKLRTLTLPVWAASCVGAGADLMARISGQAGVLSRDKILDARQRYWICDPGRAAAELGFRAQTSLRDGVVTTLEWYRRARWLTN